MTLVDKYKAKVMETLMDQYKEDLLQVTSDRMWEVLIDNAEIKRLPDGNVQENYNAMVSELEYGYQYYNQYYSGMYASLDAYAAETLGTSTTNWRDEAMRQSEEAVLKQLVFYYVIKEENFIPDATEEKLLYDEDFNEQLEAYLEQAGCKPDAYETEAEYESKKNSYTKSFTDSYDEEYAMENVRYNYGLEKIMENFVNFIYK